LVSGNLRITYIVDKVALPAQNRPEYFGPQFQSMGESIRGTMIPQIMFMSWYEIRERTIDFPRSRVDETSPMNVMVSFISLLYNPVDTHRSGCSR
jgi:hypothetical protein